MQYQDFCDRIQEELRENPGGLTWAELKERLHLPYRQPCPEWVRRMEEEMGLSRARGAGRAYVWKIHAGDGEARSGGQGETAITVRREQARDEAQVAEVKRLAFGRTVEADVVEAQRRACPEGVSLAGEAAAGLWGGEVNDEPTCRREDG